MRMDVQAATSGPEALFSGLAEPSRVYAPHPAHSSPLRGSLIFAAAMVALTLLLSLSQFRAAGSGALSDLVPSETVFALLLGTAVFPLRLILVPLATYAVCFAIAFALRLLLNPDYVAQDLPVTALFWGAMALNALPALAAGLAGRFAAARLARTRVQGDLLLSGATTATYILMAGLGVLLVTSALSSAGVLLPRYGDFSALEAGLFRAVRIGVCGAVLMLLILERPGLREARMALIVLPLFMILGTLRLLGYAVHPTVDVELLALAVALLAPAQVAVLACVKGVVAYVVITGEFLVQIPVTSVEVIRLEVASILLLVLVYLLLLQRHRTAAERRMSRETIARLARVQALATIGYFVLDFQTGRVRVDGVAAGMLGTPLHFDIVPFLQRVRPEDRAIILEAMAERQSDTRTLSFLLAPGEAWFDTATAHYLAVHAWYEARPGGGMLAYGAMIDLTEDHRREGALAAALASLSEQQDRQTQMFSIVSHELRTPASVISMLIEEMENGASWREMGPRMRAVSDQLLSVLADMRQTVRPEQNLPVRMETLQAQDLAETIRNTFALMASGRGIDIDLDLAPEAWKPRVSDRVRLMQAISNLVKNAILHADCRRIAIGYSETRGEGGAVIGTWRVSDDGRGIPEEQRATLFDAFRRGGAQSTARADGSGLGLFVTKSSIELLGGTVSHQPRAAGGSLFLLRVPMGLPEKNEGEKVNAAPRIDIAALRAMSVLIAEDSDLIGELLVARLKRLFGKVVWARNGVEAIAAFAKEQPDIVLSDLFMPEMGGDELTAALRAQGVRCPIIGMTAAAIGDERERFEAAGTDQVLTKPVSTAQLLEAIENIGDRLPPQSRAAV